MEKRSRNSHWIEETLQDESRVTMEQVLLFESILNRNEIFSKQDLSRVSEEEFVNDIVKEHLSELKPIGVKKKFEALHSKVRQEFNRKDKDHVQLQQELLEMKKIITQLQVKLEETEKRTKPNSKQEVLEQQVMMRQLQETLNRSENMDLDDVAGARQLQKTLDTVLQSSGNSKVGENLTEIRELCLQLQEVDESIQSEINIIVDSSQAEKSRV